MGNRVGTQQRPQPLEKPFIQPDPCLSIVTVSAPSKSVRARRYSSASRGGPSPRITSVFDQLSARDPSPPLSTRRHSFSLARTKDGEPFDASAFEQSVAPHAQTLPHRKFKVIDIRAEWTIPEDTPVPQLMDQVAASLGKTPDEMQPVLQYLSSNWYHTVGTLRAVTDWSQFGFPMRLVGEMRKLIFAVKTVDGPLLPRTQTALATPDKPQPAPLTSTAAAASTASPAPSSLGSPHTHLSSPEPTASTGRSIGSRTPTPLAARVRTRSSTRLPTSTAALPPDLPIDDDPFGPAQGATVRNTEQARRRASMRIRAAKLREQRVQERPQRAPSAASRTPAPTTRSRPVTTFWKLVQAQEKLKQDQEVMKELKEAVAGISEEMRGKETHIEVLRRELQAKDMYIESLQDTLTHTVEHLAEYAEYLERYPPLDGDDTLSFHTQSTSPILASLAVRSHPATVFASASPSHSPTVIAAPVAVVPTASSSPSPPQDAPAFASSTAVLATRTVSNSGFTSWLNNISFHTISSS